MAGSKAGHVGAGGKSKALSGPLQLFSVTIRDAMTRDWSRPADARCFPTQGHADQSATSASPIFVANVGIRAGRRITSRCNFDIYR